MDEEVTRTLYGLWTEWAVFAMLFGQMAQRERNSGPLVMWLMATRGQTLAVALTAQRRKEDG
jgi:hypothetical protein